MARRTYSNREVERGIGKLTRLHTEDSRNGFDRRHTREKFGWYYVDGIRQFYISSKLPPSGSVGKGRIKSLLTNMRLRPEQFDDLCQCRMSGPDYHDFIKRLVRDNELGK